MGKISVTYFADPGCPWNYSASPALAVLRWRYREQLQWRTVTIGLSEDTARYAEHGYTPTRMAVGNLHFRKYGMPFLAEPRPQLSATARACRTVVATRLLDPPREDEVLRALQLAWFTTPLALDEDGDIAQALERVSGLDVAAVVAAIDAQETIAAYEADKLQTRTAAGSATELQGKARQSDGPVRYSAPSLVFENDAGLRLEAGGFQPVEVYDALIANLDPALERRDAPEDPLEALEPFPSGLVTQEVAAIMTPNNGTPDRMAASAALITLLGAGSVRRSALADDAIWQLA